MATWRSRSELAYLKLLERKRPRWLFVVLLILSFGYKVAVKLRHLAYDRGWLKSYKCSLPTISVGNIVAGGTGKTPFVQMLAKDLSLDGKVAILSRGYRAKKRGPYTISHGMDANVVGDEPYMLAKNLPSAVVVVGKDRVLTAEIAKAQEADYVILDDGMQHRRLKRDEEVVIINGNDPFAGDHFLPRGLLRDDKKRLKSATLIAVMDVADSPHFEKLCLRLNPYTNAPIVGIKRVVRVPELEKKRVAAFCGIARPYSFFNYLESRGLDLALKKVLPDHVAMETEELAQFAKEAKDLGACALLCTEKDRVKLSDEKFALPLATATMKLDVTFNSDAYEAFVARVHKKNEVL